MLLSLTTVFKQSRKQ